MTKLLFQLPIGQSDASDESHVNALFAMLGVVAIIAIISLVFLFQHVMVTPGFGEAGGFIVYKATQLCSFPNEYIVTDDSLANALRDTRRAKCRHTNQDAWCCAPLK